HVLAPDRADVDAPITVRFAAEGEVDRSVVAAGDAREARGDRSRGPGGLPRRRAAGGGAQLAGTLGPERRHRLHHVARWLEQMPVGEHAHAELPPHLIERHAFLLERAPVLAPLIAADLI